MDACDAKIPLVFANRAIQRLVANQLGSEVMILPNDYRVLRLVFRKRGGSWEALAAGDYRHIEVLAQAVKTWAKLRQEQRKVEVV